jgi:hypothetical protein
MNYQLRTTNKMNQEGSKAARITGFSIKNKFKFLLYSIGVTFLITLAISIHNIRLLEKEIDPEELALILDLLGMMILFIIPAAGIYSVVTHLTVWAGWCKGLPVAEAIFAPDSSDNTDLGSYPSNFVVYLDGIHQRTKDHPPKITSFLNELESRLPSDFALVKGTEIYTVLPVSLEEDKGSSRLWRVLFSMQESHPNQLLKLLASTLVQTNNIIKVGISSDGRYGPIANYQYALKICYQLHQAGFRLGRCSRVTLLGYSGGAGIALGAAEYLRRLTNSEIKVVTLCGVFSANHELEKITTISTLVGSADPVAAIGRIAYPGRLPIVRNSNWNQIMMAGRVTRSELDGMSHNGDYGPFSSYFRSRIIDRILEEI